MRDRTHLRLRGESPNPLATIPDNIRHSDAVLVSILNWNGLADTVDCLKGIERRAYPHIHFAVLDNGSAVDSTSELRMRFPDVQVVRVPRNLGFTGGHNHMIKLAIERGYGSVLILNNDCEIDIKSIAALQHTMNSDPDVAVVSSLVYRSGPNRRALMVTGWVDWGQNLSVRPSSPDAVKPAGLPTLLVGTALLLRCTALQQIGFLDDRYFAYYDDNDLSVRVSDKGLKAIYCRTSICLHRYKALHEHSAMALYLMARNQWLFWRTHTPAEFRRGMTRRLIAQSLHDLAQMKKNGVSLDKVHAITDGFWDALHGRFGEPPADRYSPWWLRRIAYAAPYFLSGLLTKPSAALRSALSR